MGGELGLSDFALLLGRSFCVNSAGRGPFHDIGIPQKRNRTAKNSVIVRPLKVNWAVCIHLINNV